MTLHKGDRFNESVSFADPVTSKPSRRLTQRRDFNQTPTYHLNACFSADSRYLVMASWDAEGDSYLLRAEVATGEITVLSVLPSASGEDYNGNNVSLVQASQWAAANTGKMLRLCHLETLEERVLLDLTGTEQRFGHPIGSIDGTKIFIPRMTKRVIPGETKDVSVMHLEVDIATGGTRELFFDEGRACNHVVPNPVDPNLLLIDRDLPPKFAHGGDEGRTSRVWVLNRITGAVTEIRPRDAHRFQIHSNWNCTGDLVFHHGRSAQGGHYIGASDAAGRSVFERWYPEFHYGHMCTHPSEDVMITDGLFTSDLVIKIHYREPDSSGAPRLEVLARHSSDWSKGQQSHPHCHVSRDGRWLSYNKGEAGRSDVYVVKIA